MKRFGFYIGVIASLLLGLLLMTVAAPSLAGASGPATPAQYAAGVAHAEHADGMASTTLPDGSQVWMTGDASQINGQNVEGGFAHFTLMREATGSAVFHPVETSYGFPTSGGHRFQSFGCLDPSCPTMDANWSDGTVFWATGIFVSGSSLWVPGVRTNVAGTNFVSAEMAQFDATTLAFKGVTAIPNTQFGVEVLSGVETLKSGHYIVGTHFAQDNEQNPGQDVDPNDATCDAFVTDCKIGDMIWVPNGQEKNPVNGGWAWHMGVFPSALNLGTGVSSVVDTDSGGYLAWSKQCDLCGGDQPQGIQQYSATSLLGPWTGGTYYPTSAPPAPARSYGVQVHPADSPSGQILVSYQVNDCCAAGNPYDPTFFYITP